MRRALSALGSAVLLAGGLAGCTDDGASRTTAEPSSSSPTREASSTPETEETEEGEGGGGPAGGSADAPATVEPTTDLLEWTPVPILRPPR